MNAIVLLFTLWFTDGTSHSFALIAPSAETCKAGIASLSKIAEEDKKVAGYAGTCFRQLAKDKGLPV